MPYEYPAKYYPPAALNGGREDLKRACQDYRG